MTDAIALTFGPHEHRKVVMASNKNQHYVPRCYLRAFSVDGLGAAISLFNIDRMRFVEMAPLKHQCSGDYFYGSDLHIEMALQGLEGEYSRALSKITEPGYKLSDEHRALLRRFWLLQHLRTESASTRAVEMTATMGAEAGVDSEMFRMNLKEAVQQSMQIFVDEMDLVDDMKVCLLRNRTDTPFITSDDPAVLSNRWYFESSRTRGASFGIGAAGSLLMLPLTPQILCLGYDGDVYGVPHDSGWVDVRNTGDVRALNEHQFLNCRANVFVRGTSHAARVQEEYVRSSALRPNARHVAHYAVFEGRDGDQSTFRAVNRSTAPDHERALIHIQTVHPRPAGWPVQIRWRPNGSVYTNGTGVGYVRRRQMELLGRDGFWKESSR